jgi:hypothetical protein
MLSATELLARRVADLDAFGNPEGQVGSEAVRPLLTHFVNVLEHCTDTFMDYECLDNGIIDPEIADSLVGGCRLLQAIEAYEPSLVRAPLLRDRQDWTCMGGGCWPSTSEGSPDSPSAAKFVAPSTSLAARAATKPIGTGLYTSTGTSAGSSTWRQLLSGYLGSAVAGGQLFPLPWVTWRLEPSPGAINVAEIVSARTWVRFVESYSHVADGLAWPDWSRAVEDFDAIHITLPAIVAAQGFRFRLGSTILEPAFWDVEQTFWLAWRFSGAQLSEVVPQDPAARSPRGFPHEG